MLVLHVPLYALRTQLPLVEREVLPRLKAHHLVVADAQLDPALLSAEAAVGLNHLFVLAGLIPASGRNAVKRRSELVDDGWNINRKFCHLPGPSLAWRFPQSILRERQVL